MRDSRELWKFGANKYFEIRKREIFQKVLMNKGNYYIIPKQLLYEF